MIENFFKKFFSLKKKSLSKILGKHEPRFDDFSKFSKVLGDICKWKYLNSNKMFIYKSIGRILREKNFFEIMALMIALNVNNDFIKKSKNFKIDYEIFKLIKKYRIFYNLNFFKKTINNIIFFNLFMSSYNNENNVEKFNNFFQKNLIKHNMLNDLNPINVLIRKFT